MKFKDFAEEVFVSPGRVFSGVMNLLLGSNRQDAEGNTKANPGLFGVLLDSAKFIARAVSGFVANHTRALSVAFWSSLVLGGAAALTVGLWPAALALVTSLEVYGLSIAALVGTGFAAQVAAVGGVVAAVNSAAVFVGATVVNTISAVSAFFTRSSDSDDFGYSGSDEGSDHGKSDGDAPAPAPASPKQSPFSGLGGPQSPEKQSPAAPAPAPEQAASPLASSKAAASSSAASPVEAASTTTAPAL